MKQRTRDIVQQGDKLFSKRESAGLPRLWQVMAEQFYPIRADFTTTRNAGDEFASHLMTGRPVLAHRELGNAIGSMLRPRGTPWFKARTDNEDLNNDATVKTWLDGKCDVMRRMMYAQNAQFLRATKQGDNDFVAFGQCIIEVTPNLYLDGVLYRSWHLKDVVWCENDELVVDTVHRNWKLEARAMVRRFPKTCSGKVKELAEKEPYTEIKCRHVVMPADDYDFQQPQRRKLPFVSLYIDIENDTILEETPAKRISYVIPRWVTVSGSPYAYSPCTVAALPDARLLQQMTLTLLEAGQKAVDPPLKATREAIVGAVNLFPGSITWADAEYDERLGAALEPIVNPNLSGLDWGEKRQEAVERMIQEAFFLNVINLPESSGGDKMTAYETQQRVQEYIRRAMPLFEPMEVEYNGRICEQTWQVAIDLGAFGDLKADMPPALSRKEINWQFESPLQSSNDRIKSEAFVQAAQLLATAVQIDPDTKYDFDAPTAFREALAGVVPAKWIPPVEVAAKGKQQAAQAAQQAQQQADMANGVAMAGQMAEAARSAGEAGSAVRQALSPEIAA